MGCRGVGGSDSVSGPSHYTRLKDELGVEVWDILDAAFESPLLWNAGKYLFRAGFKADKVEDLRKLIQFVEREIEKGGSV